MNILKKTCFGAVLSVTAIFLLLPELFQLTVYFCV